MANETEATHSALDAATQFLEVDGTRLAYRSIGAGDPIVFLSRFRGTMNDCDPAFVDAVAATRRVILFDSAGVGESAGETPTTLEEAADIAVGLSRALGFDKADFLGWSMGGMTLSILGAKYPEAVRALIPAGTLPPGGSPEVIPSPPDWSAVAGKPVYDDEDILYLFFTKTEKSRAAGLASLERIGKRKGGPGNAIGSTQAAMGGQYQAIVGHYQNQGGGTNG